MGNKQGKVLKQVLVMGKYKPGKQLGDGSTSKIYQVKTLQGSITDLVVKVMPISSKEDQKQKMKEIQLLRSINNSQYFVRYEGHEYKQSKQEIYILMEKCDKSLFDIYDKQQIDEKKRIQFAYDLIKGVAYLHSINIWHRDLKLQNILIKHDKIKIADLGQSKKTSKKYLKTFVGTYWYNSPQLFFQNKYTNKVDAWTLGILLLELFTKIRINQITIKFPGLQKSFPSKQILNQVNNIKIRQIIQSFLQRKPQNRCSVQQMAQKIIKQEQQLDSNSSDISQQPQPKSLSQSQQQQQAGQLKIDENQEYKIYEWEQTREYIEI